METFNYTGDDMQPNFYTMQQNYRTNDPESSRMASASVEPSRYWRVLKVTEAVKMYPNRTAAELAHLTEYFDAYEFNRRLSDAEQQGLIKKGRNRRCTVKGSYCHEWEPSSGC